MTRQEAEILIAKYTEGEATPDERQLVERYFHSYLANSGALPDASQLQKHDKEIWDNLAAHVGVKSRQYKLWPRIAAVAAAVALIVLGVYFFNAPRHPELVSGSPLANDIAPGKNTATLTLANGKTISLSDAKTGVIIGTDLKYNDGTNITDPSLAKAISPGGRESNTQMLIASTPRGGTYIVTLPDGTKVWLNADSKLEFPSKFGKNEQRIVRLSGEGYFEVSKDKAHPFVVQTDKQTVTVLGTHFNINAYRDESSVRTTLLEGSVRVARFSPIGGDGVARGGSKNSRNPLSPQGGSLPEGESRILKPNQQSVVTGSNRITVKEVDLDEAIAWKTGYFRFENESLQSIMRKVSRWYDVEISYENGTDQYDDLEFGGFVSRAKNISEVLKIMEKTRKVKFKIEGRKVIVIGK
jgi:transmembrane sensor